MSEVQLLKHVVLTTVQDAYCYAISNSSRFRERARDRDINQRQKFEDIKEEIVYSVNAPGFQVICGHIRLPYREVRKMILEILEGKHLDRMAAIYNNLGDSNGEEETRRFNPRPAVAGRRAG